VSAGFAACPDAAYAWTALSTARVSLPDADDRGDPVHDLLPVRRRACGIRAREVCGHHDLVRDVAALEPVAREVAHAPLGTRVDDATRGQVPNDPKEGLEPDLLPHKLRHGLARSRDRVRAHRVADPDAELEDQNRPGRRLNRPHVEALRTAGPRDHRRHRRVRDREDARRQRRQPPQMVPPARRRNEDRLLRADVKAAGRREAAGGRASFAASDAPAITDGSSVAIGTTISTPLTMKFVATPTGTTCRAMQFSIIESACAIASAMSGLESTEMSSSVSAKSSLSLETCSGIGRLKKPGMADDMTVCKPINWNEMGFETLTSGPEL